MGHGVGSFPSLCKFSCQPYGKHSIKMLYEIALFASCRIVMLQQLNTQADILSEPRQTPTLWMTAGSYKHSQNRAGFSQ